MSTKPNRYVYCCVACAALNSVLLGYDIGVAGGAMYIARDVLSLTDIQTEVILASLNFAAIPGAITARWISDNYGRTKTLALASVFFLFGSILMTIANSFMFLLLGRIILGFGVGTGLSIDPLYISEISPPGSRGTLVSWSEMAINIGIMTGFITTYLLNAYNPTVSWRIMFSIGGILPVVMLFLSLCIMPETPRYLAKTNQMQQAKIVLERLCNTKEQVELILNDLKNEKERRALLKDTSFFQLLTHSDRTIRYMILIVLFVAAAQQICGVEAFMYYTPFMLNQFGFKARSEILGITAMMGLSKTVTLFFVGCMLDTKGIGRRRMLLWSYIGMSISLLVLAFGSSLFERGIVILSIFSYVIFFSIGAGPVTWLFASEIMPTEVRAQGMVLATTVNRLCGGIIGLTFLSASTTSAGSSFVAFSIVCFIFAIVCYYYCPETQYKTLEEMYSLFEKITNTRRGVQRVRQGKNGVQPLSRQEIDTNGMNEVITNGNGIKIVVPMNDAGEKVLIE